MSLSTNIKNGSIVSFNIKVAGKSIPDTFLAYSVTVEKRINSIPTAKIIILDGEANTGKFYASSSDTFLPGAELLIEAGYDSNNELIFKGIITKQAIRIDDTVGSALEVECRDTTVKMIVGRKSQTFANKKDSDIISAIIKEYAGLVADVTATTTVWPSQPQYYVTDWDFIIARAEINGMVVTALNNKVSVFKPDANTKPVLSVSFGDNLLAFNAELDSVSQLGAVKATSWDYTDQVLISGEVSNTIAGPGNLSSKKLSEVVGLSSYQLQTTAPLNAADLTNWGKAQLLKSALSKIQGEAKFRGTALADPGKYITLQGLGDRFNGDHLISGVVHTISQGNWLTEVSLGLSARWFVEKPDVMAPSASGLLPGARGLVNGTVKKVYDDPDSQYRVLVDVPLLDSDGKGVWARLSNFYATSGAGAFFLPEVGDEVVLGFLNEDPRFPVILGSMYSSPKVRPFNELTPNKTNSSKAIVSKSGISVQFDDDNKVFTIITPRKNRIVLSDEEKGIAISDENDNSIVMSSNGITISSPKNITFKADQQVVIEGTQGVITKSSGGDINVSGLNIKQNADMQYSAKGGQIASLSGGMEVTVKGAMVMIN